MKTCGALLVLLCCCLAETQLTGDTISDNDITHQGHYGEAETRENEVMGAAQRTEDASTASTQQTCQPDIHTVLREMSALVVEQRVELRHTKTQMDAMETRLTDRLRASENKAETMETKLSASENKAETMETKLSASENKAETMETRLTDRLSASEKTVEALEVRLRASESLVEQLKSENKAQSINLNHTVSQVDELRREREERRVSFSASLVASGIVNTGPFSVATPLVYRHIFTNVGNAYNPNTGVFTAPVRGVYNFVLFVYGEGHASTPTRVSLHKNGDQVVLAESRHTSGNGEASNGASLLLEVGDVVYVKLWHNSWVRDSYNHHTTFSGHLLFPM
ncbi:uncharacterized protein LOC134064418 [Sardina pilchardus]|uniref:uncharacterized protein LOC134064418 n=1 Tax=Sardina pilchardus TaxID=27697 RepID=UPI002E134ECB